MSTHHGTFWFDARPSAGNDSRDRGAPSATLRQNRDDVWSGGLPAEAPARSPSGLIAAWDGRLDNREELALSLGESPRDLSDSELALRVFERWRLQGLKALVGEWTLAIWDRASRVLHLARDYMGARPLYCCQCADGVHWSSDLAELVMRTGCEDSLSDAFAAQFMSVHCLPRTSPYEGIHPIPAGTCASFHADGSVTNRRFWTLEAGAIRYADRRTYEEQLRALWREAVGARLRTAETPWAELSGGLDSSSVACMADWLIRNAGVPARGLRLVSHATLNSPEGDERRFIAEVERQVGVTSEIVGVEESQLRTDLALAWVTPYALQGTGLETAARIRAAGGHVVLSGRLGDAVMGCQPDNSVAVFDEIARGELWTALRSIRRWSRATRKPFLEIARKLFSADVERTADTGLELLTPRLRAMAVDRAREPILGVKRSKRALARMVLGYANGGRLDIPYRPPDLVYAYPFAHRPLVEFMLAIPGEELSAPGVTRSLMRRAFAGFVPDRILRRQSKGYYPPAAFRAARAAIAQSLPVNELEVVQRGWIDPERLQQAIRTLTDGSGTTGGDIHCVLRLESWLTARRIHFANPQRKEVNHHAVLQA